MKIDLSAFLVETLNRLTGKSPVYYKVIQNVALICAIITGLPGLIEQVGLVLPDSLLIFQNKVVAWASVIGLIVAKLSVANVSELVSKTDSLPFTENNPVAKADSVKAIRKPKKKTHAS